LCDPAVKVGFRIETVELGALQHGVEDGSTLAAGLGAEEQEVLAGNGNRPVILPMSGRRSKSTIAGTHFMGIAFDASMLSGAPAARSFTSR
jgi:hypothetical protein